MKADLPCAVVRDLLPSYVEGLTEAETTAAVKNHLESCESCRKHYEAMAIGTEIPKTEIKEVDYLKMVRKKNLIKVFVAVILAVVLVLGGVGVKLFVIGSPADSDTIIPHVVLPETGNTLTVQFTSLDSASALVDLKMETTDDTLSITARKVLVSPFHQQEQPANAIIDTTDVSTIKAFGKVIWQDGIVVDFHTNRLLTKKTPYVGNASALNQLISNMDLDSSHTLKLHTEEEPYGATLHFTADIEENRRFMVEGNAYVLLALVDNLSEVYWDDPSGYSDSITAEQANAALPALVDAYNSSHGTDLVALASVKDYGADGYHLQILRNILGI